MFKLILAIFMTVLLAACGNSVSIDGPQDLKGKQIVDSFTVTVDGDINLTGDLEVVAEGDIKISGSISAKKRGTFMVVLTSKKGSVIIDGSIKTPQGQNGAPDTGGFTVAGGEGQDGGKISISAENGSITVSGTIATGDGGVGGAAASGPLADALVRATSGGGGNGGAVTLFAGKTITISGNITSGSGQLSGTSNSINTQVDGQAIATAAEGGNGGNITAGSVTDIVKVTDTATVISGSGGFSSAATAKGDMADAKIEDGGAGGDIKFIVVDGKKASIADTKSIETGEGNGTAASNATATVRATASSGTGGTPGKLLEAAKGTRKDAGNSGTAVATITGQSAKTDPGVAAIGVKPGGRTTAIATP